MTALSSSSNYRVAIVGVGEMGRRHARVFAGLPARFTLVGVMDTSAKSAAAVARSLGVPLLTTESEAIARSDLVVLATPIGHHGATAARALAAERHVLVEKPICSRVEEALELVAEAQRRKRQLFVGHTERYNPVIRALVAEIDPREIRSIELSRRGPPHRRSIEHGVILNLGIHDLDLLGHLTQSVVELSSAVGRLSLAPSNGEERALLLVNTASGATGRIYVDRVSAARQRTIQVTTRRCVFHGDLLNHRLTRIVTASRGGAIEEVPLADDEPLVAQALDVARALDGEDAYALARGIEGARALALAERAARWIRRDAVGGAPAAAAEKL
jgi:UDP-N-acetylglucosamine 3-dehydrogenase